MSRIPSMRAVDVTRILQRNGFRFVSQRGSHQKWYNSITKSQVIVPEHKGKELPRGTLMSIITGSGLNKELFM